MEVMREEAADERDSGGNLHWNWNGMWTPLMSHSPNRNLLKNEGENELAATAFLGG
jgi:hypothetical protein